MESKLKALALRFLRGMAASAVTYMMMYVSVTQDLKTLTDLKLWVFNLVGAAITGGVLALDKYLRDYESPPQS